MKSSMLRTLGALAALSIASASYAHGAPRNTAPVVQMPPNAEVQPIEKKMAGPSVTMPGPHDTYTAPAAKAPAPKVDVQARAEQAQPLRGGETGPVVQLPQQ